MAQTHKFKIGDQVDFTSLHADLCGVLRDLGGPSPPLTVYGLPRDGYVYVTPDMSSRYAWLSNVYQLADGPW